MNKNILFEGTKVTYSKEDVVFFFNSSKEYLINQKDTKGILANLELAVEMVEKNYYLAEEFEEYLGFKIQYPVDIIAASLTMQLLVLQEKINEKVIYKGEK